MWIDNFYNSLSLPKTLKIIYKIDCVGTLKLTQKNVPIKAKNTKRKKNGLQQVPFVRSVRRGRTLCTGVNM
jgi:hypothetical protein